MMLLVLTMNTPEITIRPADERDVSALTDLVNDLGYAASIGDTRSRLTRVMATPGHRVLVAVTDSAEVVGWVHVFAAPRVESDGFAELGGLVVAAEQRGRGYGARLVEAAEAFAQRQNFGAMRIRSRTDRLHAHEFFQKNGYRQAKTQHVYEKLFSENPGTNSKE